LLSPQNLPSVPDSFVEVQAESLRLGKKHGNKNVLLVFDIDNTLLAMRQDLGSDQWFAWQEKLGDDDPQKIGKFSKLLQVQGLLYAISSMRPTHPGQPEIVRQLRDAKFPILLLTSRGYDFRDATRRELLRNGYDFRKHTLAPKKEYPGPYSPYDPTKIEQSGISNLEALLLLPDGSKPPNIRSDRPVSYSEGLYLTAGQSKGAMLRMLLHRSGNVGKFKSIVFVDDQPKHTKSIRQAFRYHSGVELVTFRYSREDANVRRFKEDRCGEKCRTTHAWRHLERTLNAVTHSTLNAPVD
jgi:hypothetical protein